MMHALSLLLASASLVAATINNAKLAAELTDQSQPFEEGNYYIQNVGTGQAIKYVQEGQQFFPSDGTPSPIVFNQHPTEPFTRLSTGNGNVKCLSAQWGYNEGGINIGANHAGVLYACAVGADADTSSTLEKPKQWWLLVPVTDNSTDSDSGSTDDIAVSITVGANSTDTLVSSTRKAITSWVKPNEYGCRKSEAWIQRHPQYVKGPRYNHSECASLLRSDQFKRLGFTKADLKSLTKRATAAVTSGTYYIIAYDHLLDMETRALTSEHIDIEGSLGTDLVPWDASDANQQWTITQAD